DPNGVMVNIADRMANEMSCLAVPRDFMLPMNERKLFPKVELTFEPKDANGFDILPIQQSIKENIQYLHWHVLGEQLEIDDPEIQRTFNLFVSIWDDGKLNMDKPDGTGYSRNLPYRCQVNQDYWTGRDLPEDQRVTEDATYTIRAWMGVMSYLLSDYNFIN